MSAQVRQGATTNAVSRTAMVTSPHWRATEAGAAVLRRGGNAIEALVAAGAALSVLYPHFCGLGGDAVWMVSDASGDVRTFLGIGQAAEAVSDITEIPLRGPKSTLTTACLADSWEKVLTHSSSHWQGKEKLASLLDEAIEIAEGGFVVSRSQSFWHDFRRTELGNWPGFAETFRGEGEQRQPALARTIRSLAKNGARDFYEGEIAHRIAGGLADVGSPLTSTDLARTQTREAAPITLPYRGLDLFAPPPPTQGVTTLGIMGVLGNLAIGDLPPSGAAYYHHLVEAVKQAFLDRHRIGDPDFSTDSAMTALLDDEILSRKAKSIDPGKAMAWPHVHRQGDTAFLGAVDAEGRCASLLQSIYFDWGSGVVVGDTGILWQNRGAAFSLDPASPNRLEPGKRPFYTLNPGMALKNGRPHLLYGTQGADGQPQTLSLLISLLADHGFDPLAALSHPRFLLGRTFSDTRDTLKIEANLGEAAIAGLSGLQHEVSAIDAFSQLGGQAGIIRIADDGLIEGAHDPRSDGGAIGLAEQAA
ncbi:gamma-glutamyltranspeptidase/glutathione hydrolase [Pararhizobium capsulatum DSM 1112]|uniref:Gamma-glutamyltranspeptidase/glutathione hydrolase n=1 Tax=Pararhizobium capsulatum DSM 1112 TaxID=1121113 RepID=A0ABU0BS43_9HYPH|nr:gamma-glutamyltransferase family protein [Pararhizobium capsulatum]MDQ0321075.1 gamma-glutamyltranspeptidase/glutathione hydrolase [Pararhizobium capsulatum DSM 1112]